MRLHKLHIYKIRSKKSPQVSHLVDCIQPDQSELFMFTQIQSILYLGTFCTVCLYTYASEIVSIF
jgi:hypothetical protein